MLCQLSYIRHMQGWSLYQSGMKVKRSPQYFFNIRILRLPGHVEDAP